MQDGFLDDIKCLGSVIRPGNPTFSNARCTSAGWKRKLAIRSSPSTIHERIVVVPERVKLRFVFGQRRARIIDGGQLSPISDQSLGRFQEPVRRGIRSVALHPLEVSTRAFQLDLRWYAIHSVPGRRVCRLHREGLSLVFIPVTSFVFPAAAARARIVSANVLGALAS
jgi:hypothetical protein